MLVEFGRLDVDIEKGMSISCTAPIGIIERLSKIDSVDLKMIIDKKSRVFVEIPDNLFDE